MTFYIAPEVLIPLVEKKPAIWDKTIDAYKDKEAKLTAWRDICSTLDPNFDTLDGRDKKEIINKISTKWSYIRDAFMRSQRKERRVKRSGVFTITSKPYRYKSMLQFLMKFVEPRVKQESCESIDLEDSTESSSDGAEDEMAPPPQKIVKTETLEDVVTHFVDTQSDPNQEHPQVTFIRSVLPSLASFDDDDNLEFQIGVLALIKQIRKKRRESMV
uniref:MADF domain-containing protein n=1 Tax=Heliothis virescens TaxID=7102 RepID=A0A2A4K541_HELVI